MWGRALLLFLLPLASCGGSGSSAPSWDDAALRNTEVFPGQARAFAVRGAAGAIELEGTVYSPSAPFDWVTGFYNARGSNELEVMIGTLPEEGCESEAPGTLGYRTRIASLAPGTYQLSVRHKWMGAAGGAGATDTLKFAGEVVVR